MKRISILAPAGSVLFESVADCLAARLSTLVPPSGEGEYMLYTGADTVFLPDAPLCRLLDYDRAVLGSLGAPLAVLCPVEEGEAALEESASAEEFEVRLRALAEKLFRAGCECVDAPAPLNARERRKRLEEYRVEVLERLLDGGVSIPCFDGVMISPLAKVGAGTEILPGTQLRHGVSVGCGCVIGPASLLEEATVGDRCTVNSTQIYRSTLDEDVKIGPFCHVRPGSHLCRGVKVGDFVEIKNSTVGADTHASHLTYIGDSDVGERVNFGCGVVTVNYNGVSKSRCVIGNDAFIGCNTNLVAPVTVGDFGYTAAGSTVTDNVGEGELAIARARQVNKAGWVKRFREKNKK